MFVASVILECSGLHLFAMATTSWYVLYVISKVMRYYYCELCEVIA